MNRSAVAGPAELFRSCGEQIRVARAVLDEVIREMETVSKNTLGAHATSESLAEVDPARLAHFPDPPSRAPSLRLEQDQDD